MDGQDRPQGCPRNGRMRQTRADALRQSGRNIGAPQGLNDDLHSILRHPVRQRLHLCMLNLPLFRKDSMSSTEKAMPVFSRCFFTCATISSKG